MDKPAKEPSVDLSFMTKEQLIKEMYDRSISHELAVDDFSRHINQLEKDLKKAKKRHTLEDAVGKAMVKGFRSPGNFIRMPKALLKVARSYKRGTLPSQFAASPAAVSAPAALGASNLSKIKDSENAILFMATNGAGLGHLTRSLAVARRIKRMAPEREIVFLTTSPALTIVQREGFTAYNIPAKSLINNNITGKQWSALLENILLNLFALYDFKTMVFDGALPYAALVSCLSIQEDLLKVWIKRGNEKKYSGEARDDAEDHFDFVIVPAELNSEGESREGKHVNVDPILYLDQDELLSRDEVRKLLNIPAGKKLVYVQLGAGNINDIGSQIGQIVQTLKARGDIMIALGESIIGQPLDIFDEDVVVIKDYPNSKYFAGFDFAVSATGYNTFHELVCFGVPSLFLPNMQTLTDDQYSRAMYAENAGVGLVLAQTPQALLETAFDKLADDVTNKRMRELSVAFEGANGAASAARFIVESMNS